MKLKKKFAALAVGLLMATGLSMAVPQAAQAAASCGGTYTIVVGGFNDPTSSIFRGNVSQRVGYSAALNSQSARQGVNEVNRLIRNHRAACPGQHAKLIGYSEGAAVAHIWTTENWRTFGNVNTVLIADPKRAPEGHGSGGFAGIPGSGIIGYPLAGVDNFYGNIPTVTICTDDVICDSTAPSGWLGYYPGHNHQNYSFNADDYSNTGNGQFFYGHFFPR